MGKHKINLVLPKCYIKLYDGLGAMQPQEPVVAILLWVNTRYMPCCPNVISHDGPWPIQLQEPGTDATLSLENELMPSIVPFIFLHFYFCFVPPFEINA